LSFFSGVEKFVASDASKAVTVTLAATTHSKRLRHDIFAKQSAPGWQCMRTQVRPRRRRDRPLPRKFDRGRNRRMYRGGAVA
jgi:hypothetical protein